MKVAYDVKVNYFKCAENYSGDESEKVMGLAIKISATCVLKKQYKPSTMLSTKERPPTGEPQNGTRPRSPLPGATLTSSASSDL
jgi:aryl-alcohol dehydrogenase-like predicted oxidoreductase